MQSRTSHNKMDPIGISADDFTVDSDTISNQSNEADSLAMYDGLADICQNNIQYFERDTTTIAGQQFFEAFRNIAKELVILRRYVAEFSGFMHEYDFDEKTPGNGYRSIVKVAHKYIKRTMKVSKHIAHHRGNVLFRKQTYVK